MVVRRECGSPMVGETKIFEKIGERSGRHVRSRFNGVFFFRKAHIHEVLELRAIQR
jgi:hypothetical protein